MSNIDIKAIWCDPVWSKVIASIILAIFTAICIFFREKLKKFWLYILDYFKCNNKKSKIPITEDKSSQIEENKKNSKYDPAKIDKYLPIHDFMRQFISETLSYNSTDYQKCMQLLKDTRNANILFPDNEVKDYINELFKNGKLLARYGLELDKLLIDDKKRESVLGKREELLDWFTEQADRTDNIFKPYLNKDK